MSRQPSRVLVASCLALLAPATAHAVCHVTSEGSSGNSGADWSAPMDLQSALASAGCDEIWVAKGVYKPTTGTDLEISFRPRPGTAIYGGFAGDETSRDARNPSVHRSVLSGDLGGDDLTDADGVLANASAIVGSNSRHVVYLLDFPTAFGADTVLDGFTITGGSATSGTLSAGAGLYCDGTNQGCSPTLANLVFSGNQAGNGGAVSIIGRSGGLASPTFEAVRFVGNRATFGGALEVDAGGGTSRPRFDRVSFHDNQAEFHGGAVVALSNADIEFRNSNFSSNRTTQTNGFGGAIYTNSVYGPNQLRFYNVTFHGNSEGNGFASAIWAQENQSVSPPPTEWIYDNVTFADNSAPRSGILVRSDGTDVRHTFRNLIAWNNSDGQPTALHILFQIQGPASFSHAIVEAVCDPALVTNFSCASVSTADPKLAALGAYGGSVQTVRLLPDSPAIDAGDDVVCNAAGVNAQDARGVLRPQGAHCDLGAFEYRSLDFPRPDEVFDNGFETLPP